MNSLRCVTFVLAAITLSSATVLKPSASGDNFELLILHNNDMHARFEQTSQLSGACTTDDREAGKCYGGFPRVAHVVKEARRAAQSGEGPPVLYLNAGDTYTGTAWFTIYKWKIAAEFINALQPDAVCLGNHEFDEAVRGVIPFIQNLNSPVLAANIILDKVPELRKENNLHASIVLLINGKKIGIIGYLTPETKYLAPRNDVEYEDEVIAIRREVKKLKSQGVKILIALGHSGFLKDIEIAKEVEDIDLVIGGHSNTFLWNSNTTMEIPEIPQGPYPTIITHPSGKKVRVVQAYAYTKYLGKLHMIFDTDGEILTCNGEPILLNQKIPRDPELLTIVSKYQSSVGRINSEVLGTSLVTLNGEHCRLRECNIGNLITTAMLNYTKEYHNDEYPNVNIAIVQGGRIRASIDHGKEPFNITRGDLVTVLPFTDTLTIVHMNGSVLKQSLEHSIATWRTIDSTGQFLQFDGMEVIYDLAKPPGSRLVKAKAVCSNCGQSKPVDVKDYYEYEVMMPTFLAENGDGYMMFNGLHSEILTYNEVECVMDYLKKYSPIYPKLSGRIVILNEDKVEKLELMTEVSKSEHSSSSALIGNKTMKLYYLIFIISSLYKLA